MMTVREYADDVNRSVLVILDKCNSLGFSNIKSEDDLLTEEQVIEIRKQYKNGATQKDLSVQYGVGWSTIHNIVFNLTWKHLL